MGGEIWGVEVFHAYDHHSQVKKSLIWIHTTEWKQALEKEPVTHVTVTSARSLNELELLNLEDKNNYLGEFISCMNNTLPTLLSLWV